MQRVMFDPETGEWVVASSIVCASETELEVLMAARARLDKNLNHEEYGWGDYTLVMGIAIEWKNTGMIHAFTQCLENGRGKGELMPCLFIQLPCYGNDTEVPQEPMAFCKMIPHLAEPISKRILCIPFWTNRNEELAADCFLREGNTASKPKLVLTRSA